jgi:hypothetical protein
MYISEDDVLDSFDSYEGSQTISVESWFTVVIRGLPVDQLPVD